jgi:class 3 adenylate cyclase
MPIYMDRHNVQGASDDAVQTAHHKDLEIQDKYHVRFLTYWFDSRRGSVFCLVDAPDEEAVKKVHSEAHGLIPSEVIPVDLNNVEAFLGRIADPEPEAAPSGEKRLPIDSAFRCVMFTDLQDSTAMSRKIGDTAAFALLQQHDSIIQEALAANRGRVIKHTGDGMMAAFTDVVSSIQCAIAIQKAFQQFNGTNPRLPLYVRIGLNAGEPIERGQDLFGMTVQLAARVCGHCEPEQVLVSGVIFELCRQENLEVIFTDSGKAHFKGFDHAIQLYQIDWRPLAAENALNINGS